MLLLITHALVFSATSPFFMQEQVPSYDYALGETRTHEIDVGRHADHLPSHGTPATVLKGLRCDQPKYLYYQSTPWAEL